MYVSSNVNSRCLYQFLNVSNNNFNIFLFQACVIGAALLILLVVLIIVCKSRNKDKGVYKLKETKQFDWEYGNLPPTSKNSLVRESEHGV